MRRWLYPGTFDPTTRGHLDLVQRALPLCDELIIAVAENQEKHTFFTLEERLLMMRRAVAGMSGVRVISFDTLLTEQVAQLEVSAVLRGVRALSDFEYELAMALLNRKMLARFETVFLMPSEPYLYLSSSLVKEVLRYGGEVGEFVPPEVSAALKEIRAPGRRRDG
jgi:pantetheine-phosphate adenylyltransferase